jgi:hypothetical protein
MLEGYENVRAYCYNCEFMARAVYYFEREFSINEYRYTQANIGMDIV